MSWANPDWGQRWQNPETGMDEDRGRDGAEGSLVTLEAAELEADPPTVLAPSSGWSGVGSHDTKHFFTGGQYRMVQSPFYKNAFHSPLIIKSFLSFSPARSAEGTTPMVTTPARSAEDATPTVTSPARLTEEATPTATSPAR